MRNSIPLLTAIAFAASAAAAAQQGAPIRQETAATHSASSASIISTQPEYSQSMQKLQQATQQLRDSIHSMARKPPGPEREQAIKDAHNALFAAQQAMQSLPPELREAGTASSAGYDQSVRKLMSAADSLRASVQAMAQQPAGEGRNQAIREADRALLETQQAMAGAYAAGDSTRSMGAGADTHTQAGSQSSTAADSHGKTSGNDVGNAAAPVASAAIVLLPMQMASDDKLADGCWVRFYDGKNFNGSTLTLAGPVQMPRMSPAGSVWRDWESAKVGPKAHVTTYDNENFQQRTAKLDPGQQIADLHEKKLGWFDEVHSARVNCTS